MSSSLSQAERNYSQLHREALAIVFAVKFVYGHKVTVYTDCKALESLLSNEKNLNCVINSRFLRWILLLQNYDLTIKFRSSSHTKEADALSRLPIEESNEIEDVSLESLNFINMMNESPDECVSMEDAKRETNKHVLCQKLYNFVFSRFGTFL